MNADTLIQYLLEAVEVGDDGVWLEHEYEPEERRSPDSGHLITRYQFRVMHPVHGQIGLLTGDHHSHDDSFHVGVVSLHEHPKYVGQWNRPSRGVRDNYEGASRTLVRAGLRSLMKHIPGLEKIYGETRITGTHSIAAIRKKNSKFANTSINIPRSMRPSL